MVQENKNIFNIINLGKMYGNKVFDDTVKYAKKYGFQIGNGKNATWNNEADAFKHAYMQAQLSLWCGKHLAKGFGLFHELQGDLLNHQSCNEKQMDLWNNRVGRDIAKEILEEYGIFATIPFNNKVNDIIAEKIIKKMKKGELITNPNENIKSKNVTGYASDIAETDINKEESDKIISELLGNYSKHLLKNSFSKNYYNQNGHWVTIDGNHVFIED